MTNKQTTIIVTPENDGFRVSVNGEQTGYFANGGIAASHYALQLIEVRRLESVISDFAAWMHSRTPDQVRQLDAGQLRLRADQLLFDAGLKTSN